MKHLTASPIKLEDVYQLEGSGLMKKQRKKCFCIEVPRHERDAGNGEPRK